MIKAGRGARGGRTEAQEAREAWDPVTEAGATAYFAYLGALAGVGIDDRSIAGAATTGPRTERPGAR
ncbi:hypothetical protein ACWEN6_03665 [Sphaerisporangium sp. NPDC004334]